MARSAFNLPASGNGICRPREAFEPTGQRSAGRIRAFYFWASRSGTVEQRDRILPHQPPARLTVPFNTAFRADWCVRRMTIKAASGYHIHDKQHCAATELAGPCGTPIPTQKTLKTIREILPRASFLLGMTSTEQTPASSTACLHSLSVARR